jgi:hypothetical protein
LSGDSRPCPGWTRSLIGSANASPGFPSVSRLESQELAGTGREAAVREAGIAALNESCHDLDAAAGLRCRLAVR